MVAWPLRHLRILLVLGLVGIGQVPASAARQRMAGDAEVVEPYLAVFDQPDETAFETGRLRRGDRVRIRGRIDGGWAAIDPPPSTIGWIERAALELDRDTEETTGRALPARGTVVMPGVVVRSGRLEARMPGPPWYELPVGATVQIVDRTPLTIGRGESASTWLALVPSGTVVCYVREEGLRVLPRREPTAEVLASYLVADETMAPTSSLPPEVVAEIDRVDAMQRAMLSTQPIALWRFDEIRSGYLAILKRWGDQKAVEEALRSRMARVTRQEQAARAAREFQEVLERSRQRDADVDQLKRRLAAVDRYRTVRYHAVGTVRPTSRMHNGHKLHALLGRDGKTLAYLDLPPGLDVEAIGPRRVGVRGALHYNRELGTRLITVRSLEPLGTRR